MLSGRTIEYPLNGYTQKADDYLVEATGIGMMEIQGFRPRQEDTMKVQTLPGFSQLSEAQKESVLNATFATMQAQHGQVECGSTAISATAYIDSNNQLHATVANVGDSEAYVVIIDDNGVVNAERLNKNLHNAKENESEIARIQSTNRFVILGRVNRQLAVTRAIGDLGTLDHDNDHAPEINHYSIALAEGQRAFIVAGCDGLFDNNTNAGKIDMVGKCIFENQQSLGKAANALVANALNTNKSKDNISSAVVAVIPGKDPISININDGHGGNVVSLALDEHFFPQLNNNIAATLGIEVVASNSPTDPVNAADAVSEQDIQIALDKIVDIAYKANQQLPKRPDGQAYTLMIANPPGDDYYLHFDGDANNMDLTTNVIRHLLINYGLTSADAPIVADEASATSAFIMSASALKKLNPAQLNEIVTAYQQICHKLVSIERHKQNNTEDFTLAPIDRAESTTMLEFVSISHLESTPERARPHQIKTQILADFDGTLTGVGGEELFYMKLPGDDFTLAQYLQEFNDNQQAVDNYVNLLLEKNPDCRIQPEARRFLMMMANRPDIDLVIISRNHKAYIIAAMRYEKIPNEIIEKIERRIFDRETFGFFKSDAVNAAKKDGIQTAFVFDDSAMPKNGLTDGQHMEKAARSNGVGEVIAPTVATGKFDWSEITKQVIVSADKNNADKININFTTKQEFLIDLKEKLDSGNYNKDQILDFFDHLKSQNGPYHLIHKQKHSVFDKFKLLFKSNKNQGESHFWHTSTYEKAVKYLKSAYLDAQKKDNISVDNETARGWELINYTRGNAMMHRKHTSTHEERVQIGKPGKK